MILWNPRIEFLYTNYRIKKANEWRSHVGDRIWESLNMEVKEQYKYKTNTHSTPRTPYSSQFSSGCCAAHLVPVYKHPSQTSCTQISHIQPHTTLVQNTYTRNIPRNRSKASNISKRICISTSQQYSSAPSSRELTSAQFSSRGSASCGFSSEGGDAFYLSIVRYG